MELETVKKGKIPGAARFVTPSGDKMVVVSERDFNDLVRAVRQGIEDAEDIASASRIMARIASGEERTFPLDILKRLRTENRVKVLREVAGLTQGELALKSKSSSAYISQLETGAANLGLESAIKIAAALGVHIDMIIPKDGDAPAKGKGRKKR